MEARISEFLKCVAKSELQTQSTALRQQVLEESFFRSHSASGDSLLSNSTHTAPLMDSMFVSSGEWSFFPRHKSYSDLQLKPESQDGSLGSGRQTPDAGSPRGKNHKLDTCIRLERKRQSNRESAKRMRKLRQLQLASLQDQVKQLKESRHKLILKAVEDEQILKQIPLLVQQCKQLQDDKRRLLELLASRSVLGVLPSAAARGASLDSSLTAPSGQSMSVQGGGSEPGLAQPDPCHGAQDTDDALGGPTRDAFLY